MKDLPKAVICLSHQLNDKNELSFESDIRLKKAMNVFYKEGCTFQG